MRVVLLVARAPRLSLLSIVAVATIDLLAIDSYLAQLLPLSFLLLLFVYYSPDEFPRTRFRLVENRGSRAHEKNKYDKRMRINSDFEILRR